MYSDPDCVFCQRIAENEFLPTPVGLVARFAPLNPVTPGHMLFIPTVHVSDAAVDPAITGMVFAAAGEWVRRTRIEANLITSIGTAATQTVFHFHVHAVPRRLGDELTLPWTGQAR